MRKSIGRAVTCTNGVVDRLIRGPARCSLHEVIRQVCERRIRVTLRELFDGFADAAMEPHASCGRQFFIQRFTNERMHEAEPADSSWRLSDKLRSHAFLDPIERPIPR